MKLRNILLIAYLALPVAYAAQPPAASIPTQSHEEKMKSDAAVAAVRYVVTPPLVESNAAISDRVRSITIIDRERRCVVEVTFSGVLNPKTADDRALPSGWLVSKASCSQDAGDN